MTGRDPTAAFLSVEQVVAGVTADLRREFPKLWDLACKFDFAERLGGCTDALAREADGVFRELWMARNNQAAFVCPRGHLHHEGSAFCTVCGAGPVLPLDRSAAGRRPA